MPSEEKAKVSFRQPSPQDIFRPVPMVLFGPFVKDGDMGVIQDIQVRGVMLCAYVGVDPIAVCFIEPNTKGLFAYVDPHYQRLGVGYQLASRTINAAASKGLNSLTAQARPGSGGALLARKLQFRLVRVAPSGEELYANF